MKVNYIQLVEKIFLKYFHFLLSSSWKFHFSFREICGLQSQIFMISGKEA